MYGQSSFSASKTSASPKGLSALLLGLIVCYQLVNHIILHSAASHEDANFESDEGCTADCMEAKLFQGWHELPADSPEDLEHLLTVSPSALSRATLTAASSLPSAPAAEEPPSTQGLHGDAKPEGNKDGILAPQSADVKPEALEGLLWDLAFAMGGGDKSHAAHVHAVHAPSTSKPSAFMAKKSKAPALKKPSFTQSLTDLQQKLEAKMQARAKTHAAHRALRALHVAARGQSQEDKDEATTDTVTPTPDLDELTQQLGDQIRHDMKAWEKERADHAAVFAAAQKTKAVKYDVMTPWAHGLDDLQHKMEHDLEARDKERAEHAAAHEAAHAQRLAAMHASSSPKLPSEAAAETKTSFMNEIDALGRELCQDPDRRDQPACAQFLLPHASAANGHAAERKAHQDSHENAMTHIKLLEKHLHELEHDRDHDNEEIKKESVDFLKELCADPARHSYPACARVLATTTPTPAVGNLRSSRGASSQPHALHYKEMTEAEAANKPHHVDSNHLVMQRQDLHLAHWAGKIPSVACVTVLPEGQVTDSLMRYFIDNYRLQNYEGPRELVLVYSSADKDAARLAHLYADGTSIKAAAARGGEEFPGATAFRYGAWQGRDADLVVRWDFEAWHHPHRISMQVRAMTLSERPASLVTSVTAFDNDGKKAVVAGGAGPHGSMMGNAAWMRKHWMPFLEEETTVLHGLHSSDVVQVAMPELLSYHDASMLGASQQ